MVRLQPHLPTATRFTVDRVSIPGPFGSEADAFTTDPTAVNPLTTTKKTNVTYQ